MNLAGNELFNDIGLMSNHYGEAGQKEILDIVKALQAQEGVTDIANLAAGGALQPQSLETQLAMLTFQEKHLKFFKDIGVHKAFSTLEEYSVQDGYGTEGGFVGQMENPEEDDAEFQRKYAVMKYIRTLWRVSDVLQYARLITDAEVINVQASMMRALRTTERQLFFGDSTIIPSAFDGVIATVKNLAPNNIFDLRGANITEYNMKLGAEVIAANYGTPTKMYTSLSVMSTITNILDSSKQRLIQQEVGGAFDLGHAIKGVKTAYGDFALEPDIFINPESQGVPKIKDTSNPGSFVEGASSVKAPATPTFTLSANTGVIGSLWSSVSGDSGGAVAGTYYYRVVAVNQYGKSMAAAAQSVAVAAGGSISIVITSGGGAYAPTGYEVYRGTTPNVTGDSILYMGSIKKGTGATTTYTDLNGDLPGTSQAVLMDLTATGELRTVSLAQLAPIHKVEYAKIGPYRWGTVNFYCVPKFYAPLRFVVFRNIGVNKLIRNQLIDL